MAVVGLEDVAEEAAYAGEGFAAGSEGVAPRVGPDAEVGDGVYAGGGSFDGTVKAFMPGRSGRRVAGDGLARGFGFLRGASMVCNAAARSAGPLKLGVGGDTGV